MRKKMLMVLLSSYLSFFLLIILFGCFQVVLTEGFRALYKGWGSFAYFIKHQSIWCKYWWHTSILGCTWCWISFIYIIWGIYLYWCWTWLCCFNLAICAWFFSWLPFFLCNVFLKYVHYFKSFKHVMCNDFNWRPTIISLKLHYHWP